MKKNNHKIHIMGYLVTMIFHMLLLKWGHLNGRVNLVLVMFGLVVGSSMIFFCLGCHWMLLEYCSGDVFAM